MGVPDVEEREKGVENLFKEIMAEIFPNLETDMNMQVHEDQRCKIIFNSKRISLTNQTVKRQRILKAAREKRHITQKETPIKTTSGFLSRNLAGQETVE